MAWAILSCYKGGEGEAAFSRRSLDDSGGFAPGDVSAAVVDFAADRRAAGGASRAVGVMVGRWGTRHENRTSRASGMDIVSIIDVHTLESKRIDIIYKVFFKI